MSIAQRWRVLSGQDHWKGASKYAKKNLFARVGLEIGNPFKYSVTKYLYATSQIPVPDAFIVKSLSREAWSKESNWIGYVAVATDEGKAVLGRRDIVVAWRGTIRTLEWINDFQFLLLPAPIIFGGSGLMDPKVHQGWTRFRRSTATLNAVDIPQNGYNKPSKAPEKSFPVTAFLYACPRVGELNFKRVFNGLKDLRTLRIKNILDIVPNYPTFPYLDMGTHGLNGIFELVVNHDIALTNKSDDSLKDENLVPASWWIEKNKGMVQKEDGSWELMDHEEDSF
ncbi:hypothetical protein K1719_038991 [Acacia pycnantha]|nr:hypothetical protein K1719_038991 [Acacia pycnantha]